MEQTLLIYLKLLACASVSVVASAVFYLLKRRTSFRKFPYWSQQLLIGLVFGAISIFGTEYGVDVGGATANARDAAPLCAGFIFGAPAGIIAGIIGGVERWFAVAWGAGMYSRLACSVSTVFAGFYAALLRKVVFDNKRPTWPIAFVTGAVMEVIHMTLFLFTHIKDPQKAFEIITICTTPMAICNGVSVLLSIVVVTIISSGIHKHAKHYHNISQLVQTPMLISVVLAFLASSSFVYLIQTFSAQENISSLMQLHIDDVYQEIHTASDKLALNVTEQIASEIESNPDINLYELKSKYDVSFIWIVDNNGIVIDSTTGETGYDMHSDSDLPEESRQSSAFLVLLDGKTKEYVQECKQFNEIPENINKLAGVSLSNGGFVQSGYDSATLQNKLNEIVKEIGINRRINKTGQLYIADNQNIIVSNSEKNDVAKLSDIGYVSNNDNEENNLFRAELKGVKNFCMYSTVENFTILAVVPEEEVFEERSTMGYINSYMEIIIFAALFILIYIILRRVVVNNLKKINSDLSRIIGGNLETTIDVNTSDEFASLSNDINSTVGTLKHYIDEAASRIDKELAFAKNIQHASLPSVFPPYPDRSEFDIFASMCTAKEVGGDFYDFYLIDEKHVAILIADVSGKGIPAAMFMMTAKTMIKNFAETGVSVDEIFTKANEKLCEGNEAGMFVTAWMAIIDTDTGHVEYTNAGHNPPVIYRNGQGFEYLKTKAGFVLAGMDGVKYKRQELDLNPGDKIFVYTDGVTEATAAGNILYGEDRLLEFLNKNCSKCAEDVIKSVKTDIDTFVGDAEQFDDITMLMFEYVGKEPEILMNYMNFPASDDSLQAATDFITEQLEMNDASPKAVMQTAVAFEEMFVNVAHYAYKGKVGEIIIGVKVDDGVATIELKDEGIPFNPFLRDDPDITLSAEERQIGGLGIFMVRKVMDAFDYEYRNGCNIVTLKKNI